MDDLKSVTVRYLRELARKHLGRGHSKLKTKEELIAALGKLVPGLGKRAGRTASTAAAPREDERSAAPPSARRTARSRAPHEERAGGRRPRAELSARAGTVDSAAEPSAARPAAGVASRPPPPPPPPEQQEAEPLLEGFFVARIAGELEARRHHMTEDSTRGAWRMVGELSEGLGDIAAAYEDDAAVLLPRDPHTLFVFWDFSPGTRSRAAEGLVEPRAILRVFEEERPIRDVDFALESRSYYLHGLTPGRTYRVEAHFVGRDGQSRRIGGSTNRVTLPALGPSPDRTVRYMRVPAAASAPPVRQGEVREYLTWRRVALPGSDGFVDVPEIRREREALVPEHLPPPPRPPGASDQALWTPPPSGRGRSGTP